MIIDYYYKLRYGWWGNVKFSIQMWIMWDVWGWPKWRRCPQCAGDGLYATDMEARYGNEAMTCPLCNGTGKIHRDTFKRGGKKK